MHSRPISCAELHEHYEAVMQNARIFLRVRDFENVLALYRSKQRRIFSRTITDHNSFTNPVIARRVS